jgi:sugar phosphate isomerase/epimerase
MPEISSSRRSFLAAAAGAAVAARFADAAPAAPGAVRARKLKLGVASYSLRKFSLDQAIEMCKEMGVSYITLKDMHLPRTDPPEATLAAKKKIEAAGLTILGGGVIYMKKDEAQVRKDFEYARVAGFPTIVASPDPDALDLVERMIREYNIPVAIHNHGPEDKFYPAPQDVYRVIKDRDKRLGICMDIGHAARTGVDVVKAIFDCQPRVFDVHMKDLSDVKVKDSQVEVGRGALDITGFLKALIKTGFQGHTALEYEINADNPLPGMKESFAYMRGVLDGLSSV